MHMSTDTYSPIYLPTGGTGGGGGRERQSTPPPTRRTLNLHARMLLIAIVSWLLGNLYRLPQGKIVDRMLRVIYDRSQ